MRHTVNFALLFAFGTLAATGVMAFVAPFSLTTTRVHILFGLLTLALIAAHLWHRTTYFRKQIEGVTQKDRPGLKLRMLLGIVVVWIVAVAAAILNWTPVAELVDQGYEARHRTAIVRTSSLVGFIDGDAKRLIARKAGKDADVRISLMIGWGESGPTPAMAVWAETTTGAMIETLYLDESLAYNTKPTWAGEPTPRHHILPIWRNRYTLVSGVEPTGEIDAFSATTPTHKFTLDSYLKLGQKKEFVLCVEVNAPNDPNEHFKDPHIGQPSTWYTAYVKVDKKQPYTLMELTGYGGSPEQRGEIQYDIEQITTARRLIDLLLVRVTPLQGEPPGIETEDGEQGDDEP